MSIRKTKSINLYMLSWLILPVVVLSFTFSYIKTANKMVKAHVGEKSEYVDLYFDYIVRKPFYKKLDGSGNKPYVTLWFDDAWKSQYEKGLKILDKQKVRGAVAVPTGMIGYGAYMTWDELRQMQARGWEMTSHSVSHDCDYVNASALDMLEELTKSQSTLHLEGLENTQYVTPCGVKNDFLINLAKRHYHSFRTVEEGVNPLPLTDPYALKVVGVEEEKTMEDITKWISEAKKKNAWLIFMFHKIGDKDAYYSVKESLLKQLILEVKKEEIEIVLPTEVVNTYYEK